MEIKKFDDGNNVFCQVTEQSAKLETQAEIEKQKISLEKEYEKITEDYNERLNVINQKLDVFK